MTVQLDPLARVRDLQPEASAALAHAGAVAWASTDPDLLELCRQLIVLRLRGGHEHAAGSRPLDREKLDALDGWEASDVFSPVERAHLGYTEQFVLSVSGVTDAHVEALREHADEQAVYHFAAALYVVEMTERLRLVAGAVLAPGGEPI